MSHFILLDVRRPEFCAAGARGKMEALLQSNHGIPGKYIPKPGLNCKNLSRIFCAVICILAWIGLYGCMGNLNRQEEKDLRKSIDGSYLYGPINGYLQTPSGGTPGTTSNQRPTFKEFDLDNVGIPDISFHVSKGVHTLYAGTQLIRLQSETSLDNRLISQAKTYPAGSSVKLDAKLDWHRFGYQHLFRYGYGKKATFGFYPGIEFAIFDFHYKLNGQDNLSTDRRYMQGTLRFGGGAEWSPGGRFSLSADTLVSIPIPTFIFSLNVMGKYQLWGKADQGGALYLGVTYEIIDFEDSQEVPNHIRAEIGPMVHVKFQVNF